MDSTVLDQVPGYRESRKALIRAGIQSGRLVPILPRHGLYVHVCTLDGRRPDGRRFAALFLETWRRFPLGVRRSLLAYWRTRPGKITIELTGGLMDVYTAIAMAADEGFSLRFDAGLADAMPGDIMQSVIAHELAHAYQSAIGIRCTERFENGMVGWTRANGNFLGGRPELEEDADMMMEFWGFDSESIEQWMLETGRMKRIELPDTPENWLLVLEKILREGR
jgi:hypothetical protein